VAQRVDSHPIQHAAAHNFGIWAVTPRGREAATEWQCNSACADASAERESSLLGKPLKAASPHLSLSMLLERTMFNLLNPYFIRRRTSRSVESEYALGRSFQIMTTQIVIPSTR
jgi:hypothetical protein